jgi:hypothetical protein
MLLQQDVDMFFDLYQFQKSYKDAVTSKDKNKRRNWSKDFKIVP